MSGEPRDFIYLDDESVNNHLASMGVGVAQSKQQTETEEEESLRRRFATLAPKNLGKTGAEDKQRNRTSETEALTLDLTAPYRFEKLRESLQKSDYQIHASNDISGTTDRGAVLELSCDIIPVSYARLEVALVAKQQAHRHKSLDENIQEQFERAETLLEQIQNRNNGRFVARGFFGGREAGLPLKREHFRQPPAEVFRSQRQFTVFGRIRRGLDRVEKHRREKLDDAEVDLDWREAWDPLGGSTVAETDQTETLETLRKVVRALPGDHPFTEPSGKLPIVGESSEMVNMVIHPIAVYW